MRLAPEWDAIGLIVEQIDPPGPRCALLRGRQPEAALLRGEIGRDERVRVSEVRKPALPQRRR